MPSLTSHSLRRTFASRLFAIGEGPWYVMAQMGHATAELTLAVYARPMGRRDGEPERLRALVNGAEIGTATDSHDTILAFDDQPRRHDEGESGRFAACSRTRPAGFEPATSRSGGDLGKRDTAGETACLLGFASVRRPADRGGYRPMEADTGNRIGLLSNGGDGLAVAVPAARGVSVDA